MNKKFSIKFLKFGLVGFSGVFIDYGTTYFLKEIIIIDKYIANSIGFTIAATNNYYLNRLWTFKSTNPKMVKEYIVFLIISIFGLILNNLIIWLLNDYLFNFNFYLAKLFAIGIVFIWNFTMNNFFNFKIS